MNLSLILVLVSIVLSSFGQVTMKYGTMQLTQLININVFQKLLVYFTNIYIVLGFVLYALSAFIWIFAISKLPLSIAYPLVGISYVIVMVLSYFMFKEPITLTKVIGVLLIISGVIVIARS